MHRDMCSDHLYHLSIFPCFLYLPTCHSVGLVPDLKFICVKGDVKILNLLISECLIFIKSF